MKHLATATLAGLAWAARPAFAHEGHGMEGVTHWHATDVWGFVILGVVMIGAVMWLRGRR